MPNSYVVITTTLNLKLVNKTKSTKNIWFFTNIQKEQDTILSKHPNQNNHKFTILAFSITPEITSILKKLNRPHSSIDISKKKNIFIKPNKKIIKVN